MIEGGCLCGAVRFAIDGRISGISRCHCSVCRKVSGATGKATMATATRSFRWVAGEDVPVRWRRPSGFVSSFCPTCGAPVPWPHENGKIVVIPAGSLDGDPGTRVERHIFVASKAPWDEIGGDAPQYGEGPPD